MSESPTTPPSPSTPSGSTGSTGSERTDNSLSLAPGSGAHRRKPLLTRRSVIGAVGAVAAAGALTPVVFAAADAGDDEDTAPGTAPQEFPATRSDANAGAGVATTVFGASYVGVRWAGPRNAVALRLPGGQWQTLRGGCATVKDGGTALVAANSASTYEIRAAEGAMDVRSLAIDTRRGPKRAFAVPTEPTRIRGVRYFSRPAWGADESKRYKDGVVNSPEQYYPFQTITVHHTDTPNGDSDPAATIRAMYEYHAITLDWGDIGYHFLIDEEGNVYEGRYSGEDGAPAFDEDGNLVTAFHTSGFNSGNLGIALLGNLTDRGPSVAAKASLIRLIKALCRFKGLDPRARTTFVNPVNGVTKEVPVISGHRDWLATECPGQTMYDLLDEVRKAAAAR